jgi:outer membrane protein assembly factor BamB
MHYLGHLRVLLLTAAILLPGPTLAFTNSARAQDQSQTAGAEVNLHWGARPGVSRYRLQLASDSAFADIIFDRVVSGIEYRINDLSPGKYFWRISALTDKAGAFSSAGVIQVPVSNSSGTREPTQSIPVINKPETRLVVARGGWRASVGDIAHPVLAHLRSPVALDLVGINSEGVVFALEAATGIALWSAGRKAATGNSPKFVAGSSALLLLRTRVGMDNVVWSSGSVAIAIQGATGRELWRSRLPVSAVTGATVSDGSSSRIFLIDNSWQRAMVLDANNGSLLTRINLPHRVKGAPLVLPGASRMVLAYETGLIEIRDVSGTVIRSGDAGSPATTPPVFVHGRNGDLILVGTAGGLTALTAEDLHPLGMVAINNDAPRGTLATADLNGDGSPEVIMMTDRGHVIAVSAADGKILWEANGPNESETVTFADVNGDRVLDVLLAGGQSFALALSGRDGSIVWQDSEGPPLVSNHSVSLGPRTLVAMPYGAGVLLIGGDQTRMSLRAVEFPNATGGRSR